MLAMSPTTVNTATLAAYSSPFASTAATPAVTATVIPSSTVTLSAAGVGLLERLGQSAVNVAEGGTATATDAVDLPVDLATNLVTGLAGALEGVGKATADLGSGNLGAMATDAGAAARSLVAMPEAIVSSAVTDLKSLATDATTLGSGLLGLSTLGAV
jgi:hypothetical protein